MIGTATSHAELCRDFAWDVPEFYNIGVDICDKWAKTQPERLALIDVDPQGDSREYSFLDLQNRSNQLANALTDLGIRLAMRSATGSGFCCLRVLRPR